MDCPHRGRKYRARRSFLAGSAAAASLVGRPGVAPTPQTVSLWHVFNLDTDMIYPGMKTFNASQSEYHVEPRLVPGDADRYRTDPRDRHRIGTRTW